MATVPARSRIVELMKLQSSIFRTTHNPSGLRIGTAILASRLKGSSVASYYPPRIGTTKQLRALYPDWAVIDDKEEDWVESLNIAKSRGKGAPKKKRTAAESKKFQKRR
ncbi:hypothetical protein P154DRAFT_621406 [Amniculicola lignicola CBS 123094]|uniref:Small ribosomal subunit protein mS33 n=1 Tax=Amniculicola lignicola CBS 123094 TaxID=1392246 RepID=A0A6A5WBX2_9PLEO|nr:hypothetical protein P154DRAFT_621406 [Amniculicola lignicola CBS 123094]